MTIKMHDDHAASCVCCLYFSVYYESDWSDVTPGAGFTATCGKNHWWLGETDGATDWHSAISQAQSCGDFEPR